VRIADAVHRLKVRGMPTVATTRQPRVLHVEDDPAVAASVRMLLRSAGFDIASAADGPSALQALEDGAIPLPDVLIVDFNLPGDMDGAEVAEAIARAAHHAVPTIVLSGELTNATLPWLPGVPIWPLAKPCAPQKLLEAVTCLASIQV
jgi:two-component system, chemotaxis family, CheB/CheR fusion protein